MRYLCFICVYLWLALLSLPIDSAAQSVANPFGGSAALVETMHLSVAPSVSATQVAPGKSVTVAFDVAPKPTMHVYAPGKHDYQVVTVTVDPRPWLKVQPLAYPPSEIYHFKELNEKVEVYSKPFTLLQEVTLLATPEARKALAGASRVTVSGNLEYQACDDKVCYSPRKVPFSFTVDVTPLDRRPSGD